MDIYVLKGTRTALVMVVLGGRHRLPFCVRAFSSSPFCVARAIGSFVCCASRQDRERVVMPNCLPHILQLIKERDLYLIFSHLLVSYRDVKNQDQRDKI